MNDHVTNDHAEPGLGMIVVVLVAIGVMTGIMFVTALVWGGSATLA
jgi:hypothetical protein